MRQPLEDPAVLTNKPAENEKTQEERDSRSLVKRLLTFGLTDQVRVFVLGFSLVAVQHFLVNETSIYRWNITYHLQGSETYVTSENL